MVELMLCCHLDGQSADGIRLDGMKLKDLARKYDCSMSSVSNIVGMRSWRHVKEVMPS